jgi:hypothetical protein
MRPAILAVAELILWDRQLSEVEMIAMQAYQAALLAGL